jgi:hypothetical protein
MSSITKVLQSLRSARKLPGGDAVVAEAAAAAAEAAEAVDAAGEAAPAAIMLPGVSPGAAATPAKRANPPIQLLVADQGRVLLDPAHFSWFAQRCDVIIDDRSTLSSISMRANWIMVLSQPNQH